MAAHARSSESVKMCVRHGIEMVYHASFADEEALDMPEANRDKHFVATGISGHLPPRFQPSRPGLPPGKRTMRSRSPTNVGGFAIMIPWSGAGTASTL